MVKLDPSRTSVKNRRMKSTLMSGGVHCVLWARSVKYIPNREAKNINSEPMNRTIPTTSSGPNRSAQNCP